MQNFITAGHSKTHSSVSYCKIEFPLKINNCKLILIYKWNLDIVPDFKFLFPFDAFFLYFSHPPLKSQKSFPEYCMYSNNNNIIKLNCNEYRDKCKRVWAKIE